MTGAKQIMQAQAVNNHNIANVNTVGYRADARGVHQPADLRPRLRDTRQCGGGRLPAWTSRAAC